MSIAHDISEDGAHLTISITGRFDFSSHTEFRESYELDGDKPQRFTIDLADASYLDSSALGMLLLLRDYAGGDQSQVEIVNCSADVRKILTISNFEQLFTIH